MDGRVHSIETMSAVDGPGLRMVVFLQGCPLRCQYCHNPDTWETDGGTRMTAQEIARRAGRCRRFFGAQGGVTFSGGEPLWQAEFLLECIQALHGVGIRCAVDTGGGVWNEAARRAVDAADLVLLDVKHSDPARFAELTGAGCGALDGLMAHLAATRKPAWVRQVIVPGWTDDEAQILALKRRIEGICAQKIELLPYHTLGAHKWAALGIPYPLDGVRPPDARKMDALRAILR